MAQVQPVTLADLLRATNENTQVLANVLRQLQSQQADLNTLAIAPQAPVPVQLSTSLPLPLNPATLVQAVIAAQNYGVADDLFLRFATAVPAGGTATASFQVPPGYVLTTVGNFSLQSDLYDPALTASLTADGNSVLYQAYPISASDSQVLPQYGVIRRSLLATYSNGTTSPATVTATTGAALLQASVYDGVILPLLKLGYNRLELFAENQSATNQVQ